MFKKKELPSFYSDLLELSKIVVSEFKGDLAKEELQSLYKAVVKKCQEDAENGVRIIDARVKPDSHEGRELPRSDILDILIKDKTKPCHCDDDVCSIDDIEYPQEVMLLNGQGYREFKAELNLPDTDRSTLYAFTLYLLSVGQTSGLLSEETVATVKKMIETKGFPYVWAGYMDLAYCGRNTLEGGMLGYSCRKTTSIANTVAQLLDKLGIMKQDNRSYLPYCQEDRLGPLEKYLVEMGNDKDLEEDVTPVFHDILLKTITHVWVQYDISKTLQGDLHHPEDTDEFEVLFGEDILDILLDRCPA